MAAISTTQNLRSNIQQLAAQRYPYSCAKRLSAIQALLAVVTPAAALWTEAQRRTALAGILVPLLDIGWLDPWQGLE